LEEITPNLSQLFLNLPSQPNPIVKISRNGQLKPPISLKDLPFLLRSFPPKMLKGSKPNLRFGESLQIKPPLSNRWLNYIGINPSPSNQTILRAYFKSASFTIPPLAVFNRKAVGFIILNSLRVIKSLVVSSNGV